MLLRSRNRNLTTLAALIVVLTCILGFAIHAKQDQSHGQRRHKVQWKDDHGSGSLDAKDIELTTDSRDVNAIAKDGYLAIDERRDGIRRRLRIEPTLDGKLKRTYSVNGVAKEMDEEAKAWLAGILYDRLDLN